MNPLDQVKEITIGTKEPNDLVGEEFPYEELWNDYLDFITARLRGEFPKAEICFSSYSEMNDYEVEDGADALVEEHTGLTIREIMEACMERAFADFPLPQ